MRRQRIVPLVVAVGAGAVVFAAIAVAKSFTLDVASHGKVTNQQGMTKQERIVVDSHGLAVYALTGDTVQRPLCTTTACFSFWPPVTVAPGAKASAESGVHGKLGILHRDGFDQVTLAGHPLYTYKLDKHRRWATGQGVKSFGGTWYVIRPTGHSTSNSGSSGKTGTTTTSSMTTSPSTTTTSTSTSTSYTYPY